MDDRFNTPHTDKIELEFLGHYFQLAQDPNSKHLGTTVWDASIVFAKFLERNCKKGEFSSLRLKGKRVVEVGAGCGLAGLGLALLGCHVVATDQIEVLPLLLRNVERNMARAKQSPSESPYLGSLGTIEIAELDWGNQQQARALNPPFDYIIGTDIVYKEQLLEPLLTTFRDLAGPKTSIILGYEFRSSTVHEKMLQIWKENFNIKMIPKSKMDPKYQHVNIQLFNLRPKVPRAVILEEQQDEEALVEAVEVIFPEQCNKEAVGEPLEKDFSQGNSVSLHPPKDIERMSANNTMRQIAILDDNNPVPQIHESNVNSQDVYSGSGQPYLNNNQEDSSRGSGTDDWEIRRLGSMAARLLQNVL